jgi:hypothetical protein
VQQQFYGLACTFGIYAGPYQTSIMLSGLDEKLPEALALAENVLANVQVDTEAYQAYIMNVAKAQADAKLEQQTCFSRLRAYNIYGERNAQRNIVTAAQLAATDPQTLIDLIHSLTSYEHTVLQTGHADVVRHPVDGLVPEGVRLEGGRQLVGVTRHEVERVTVEGNLVEVAGIALELKQVAARA